MERIQKTKVFKLLAVLLVIAMVIILIITQIITRINIIIQLKY